MTTYDKPKREFEVCGVKYVETVARYSALSSMVVLKRLSEFNLSSYCWVLQAK